MSKIIINLKGGLGNQLFQAAAALSLSQIYKKKCEYIFKNNKEDKYRRNLEIYPLLKKFRVKKFEINLNKKLVYLDQYDIDHPLYFSPKSPLIYSEKNIYLEGFFFNYRIHEQKVISSIKSYIRKIKIHKNLLDLKYISIHLRELHGTDTNQIDNKIDNIDISFYIEAINRIKSNSYLSKIKNAVVFSDTWKNPENSKILPEIKFLLKKSKINYINGDLLIKSPLDILNIFSYSKCNIISNSTLSWWGAYLSNGKVFSPVMSLWEPNLKIPDSWEQIYSDEIVLRTHHNKVYFYPSIKNEEDLKFYNYQRFLNMYKFRGFLKRIYKILRLNKFIKLIKLLGLFQENHHKTFF